MTQQSSARPSVSAFFPAYNDGGTIATMVMRTLRALQALASDYEIIVVENGSTDYTPDIIEELERLYGDQGTDPKFRGRLRVLRFQQALGYGGALCTGFQAARKDLVFYTDGDAQYDPHELTVLYQYLRPDVDVVQGYKIARHDPLHRKVVGRLYHHFVRVMFRLHLRDVDCDFRLIRRRVLDSFDLHSKTGVICVELMTRIEQGGFRVAEVPVHHYHRAYGISQFFNLPRVARTLIALVRLWWDLIVRRARAPELPAASATIGPRHTTKPGQRGPQ